MAKKNLASLMSGIIGEKPEERQAQQANDNKVTQGEDVKVSTPKVEEQTRRDAEIESIVDAPSPKTEMDVHAPELTIEMHETLDARRKRNVGRPRKDAVAQKVEEVRATFIINPELIRKVKYISLAEGALLKEVVGDALADYIERWERKNGKIKLPTKR